MEEYRIRKHHDEYTIQLLYNKPQYSGYWFWKKQTGTKELWGLANDWGGWHTSYPIPQPFSTFKTEEKARKQIKIWQSEDEIIKG